MNKILTKLLIGGSVLFGGSTFTSCDNTLEYTPNPNDSIQVQLVKNPDVVAWSGQQVLGNTFGTRTVNLPAMYATRGTTSPDDVVKCQDQQQKSDWLAGAHPGYYESFDNMPQKSDDRGESVSQSEYEEVMAYLFAHPNEGYDEVDLSTYFLQNVGSAGHQYTTTPDQNGATHTTGMQMDYFEINGWHVNDYNAQGGPRIYVENWPLENCAYHDSFGQNTFNYYKFYYIPLSDGTYGLYLCFDYATISQQGNIIPDGTYDDWVIRIWPADGSEIVPPTPVDPETPVVPNTPTDEFKNNHVEVNLSLNDSHTDYVSEDLWSKLSIHVRYGTDVKITIPVESKYICESDDLIILEDHSKYELLNENHTVTYTVVKDENISWTVTLKTSFELDENDINKGEITVTTEGITQELIDYLIEQNGDGINFEVYLYWQSEINGEALDYVSREELQGYLNQSTIEFLDKYPNLYVNAFNNTETGTIFSGDCTVDVIDSQKSSYKDSETDYWYNGSPFNELYYKIVQSD